MTRKNKKKYYAINENLKYYNSKNFYENEKTLINFITFVTLIKIFELYYQ